MRERLTAADGVEPEYAEWATTDDLAEPAIVGGGMFLAVAARVGGIRLIDNIHVDATDDGLRVDRGSRISGSSMLYERENT